MAEPTKPLFTTQRVYIETKRKLDSLSRLESRSAPQQLKVIVDREFESKLPEIKEQVDES